MELIVCLVDALVAWWPNVILFIFRSVCRLMLHLGVLERSPGALSVVAGHKGGMRVNSGTTVWIERDGTATVIAREENGISLKWNKSTTAA